MLFILTVGFIFLHQFAVFSSLPCSLFSQGGYPNKTIKKTDSTTSLTFFFLSKDKLYEQGSNAIAISLQSPNSYNFTIYLIMLVKLFWVYTSNFWITKLALLSLYNMWYYWPFTLSWLCWFFSRNLTTFFTFFILLPWWAFWQ